MQGLIYCIAFFTFITSIAYLRYLFLPTETEYHYPEELENVLEFKLTKVMGKPLEKVNVDYTRNIHFSVKTSFKNYRTRLSLLLVTWFQAVEKDQVKIKLFNIANTFYNGTWIFGGVLAKNLVRCSVLHSALQAWECIS